MKLFSPLKESRITNLGLQLKHTQGMPQHFASKVTNENDVPSVEISIQ